MTSKAKPSLRQRLFARFLRNEEERSFEFYGEKKTQLFAQLSGTVLEIGPGTGVNLQFLPEGIRWIGIEPNQAMHPLLEEKAKALGIQVELRTGMSENLDIEGESVDFVISALVLCSVKDMQKTLQQILAALKPGGRFLFLEHVADHPWTFRRAIQEIAPFTPWRYFSDGCDPGRNIGQVIEKAGFSDQHYERYMQAGKGVILAVNRPHIWGWAVK